MEKYFTNDILSQRSRFHCISILSRLDADLQAHHLDCADVGIIFLFLENVLDLMRKNMDGNIALNQPWRKQTEFLGMFMCVATLLMSSLADISMNWAL